MKVVLIVQLWNSIGSTADFGRWISVAQLSDANR
jgi:hypothetical protein